MLSMQGGEKKTKQGLCYFYQDSYPDKNLEMQNTVTKILGSSKRHGDQFS